MLQFRLMQAEPKPKWYEDGLNFSCHQCGNCCTGPPGYVWLTDEEVLKMAAFLEITELEFRGNYAHKDLGRWTLNEVASDYGYDCVFLRRDEQGKALCSVYGARPVQCRTWPFWPENLKNRRAWRRAARHCAGMTAGLDADPQNQGKFFPIEEIRILRDKTPDI
jgi:Fe-S-cluster containining protein